MNFEALFWVLRPFTEQGLGYKAKYFKTVNTQITYQLDKTKMHNFWDTLKKMDDFPNLPEGAQQSRKQSNFPL